MALIDISSEINPSGFYRAEWRTIITGIRSKHRGSYEDIVGLRPAFNTAGNPSAIFRNPSRYRSNPFLR